MFYLLKCVDTHTCFAPTYRLDDYGQKANVRIAALTMMMCVVSRWWWSFLRWRPPSEKIASLNNVSEKCSSAPRTNAGMWARAAIEGTTLAGSEYLFRYMYVDPFSWPFYCNTYGYELWFSYVPATHLTPHAHQLIMKYNKWRRYAIKLCTHLKLSSMVTNNLFL